MDRVLAEFADIAEVATSAPGVTVWRARDADSDRPVLIKRLPGSYDKARTTHSLGLRHPNIVPVRRWLVDNGYLYIIRDWIPGRSLRERLADGSLRLFDRLRKLLDPVLNALVYAHAAGEAHGAFCPENVIVTEDGQAVVADFGMAASRNGSRGSAPDWDNGAQGRGRYNPPAAFLQGGRPTERADYFSLCEVYKEFLPERDSGDEEGIAARERLLRNLSDVQMSSHDAGQLRYKLDAVTRMAELLGFCSTPGGGEPTRVRIGPKLVCQVTPATAMLAAGSGASVLITVWNEGDEPLRIEAVESDVVWLNSQTRLSPFTLPPDGERDLAFHLSAARLMAGAYTSNLLVRSNHGMDTLSPQAGRSWHRHVIALPVIVSGEVDKPPVAPPPMIERLPLHTIPAKPSEADAGLAAATAASGGLAPTGIACMQDPDPTVVAYGRTGVLNVGIKNIGAMGIRVDKAATYPSWLTYPGDFQPLRIEPGSTQYLGFTVDAGSLSGGDYRANITFITSVQEEGGMEARTVWREMRCEVRVRVVRGGTSTAGPQNAGCATLLAAIAGGALALVVWIAER